MKVPTLARRCPVEAIQNWITASGRTEGPLFSGISRWGALNDAPLDVDSIEPILRRALAHAGTTEADAYSGHSLRREFANWATANGRDVTSLMAYVGWRRADTAMRYVDADTPSFEPMGSVSSTSLSSGSSAQATPAAVAAKPLSRSIVTSFGTDSRVQPPFACARHAP